MNRLFQFDIVLSYCFKLDWPVPKQPFFRHLFILHHYYALLLIFHVNYSLRINESGLSAIRYRAS